MGQQKRSWFIETYSGPPERCDQWLTKHTGHRRSFVQRWFLSPGVYVNQKRVKASHKLQGGSQVEIFTQPKLEETALHLEPIPMGLDILFEDEHLIVVNKPSGLSVHPGAGAPVPTLLHGLLAHGLQGGDSSRPGIVHRLDKDTTGAIVAAKNVDAHAKLSIQFAEKTNQRQYLALLDGTLPTDHICVENHLYRDPKNRLKFCCAPETDKGKWSSSFFQVKKTYAHTLSLVEVTLKTGRTHQIRVHSEHLKAPIIGDPLYGQSRDYPHSLPQNLRALLKPNRQMLHARTLGFQHPATGETLIFHADLPKDFKHLLDRLKPFQSDTE
ncbi:MAG: RluA family pseudouridine synthase [Oligoflexales bacterium]